MTHFAVAISEGIANSVSASDTQGRDISCLKTVGQTTFPLTLSQLLSGVSISVPVGTHHIAILGYSGTTASHPTLASLFAQRPVAKSFVVAEGDFNTVTDTSVRLTSSYDKNTATDRLVYCPLPPEGAQGALLVGDTAMRFKLQEGTWVRTDIGSGVVSVPGFHVDVSGVAHASFSFGSSVGYGNDSAGSFGNALIPTAIGPTSLAVASNGEVWVAAAVDVDPSQVGAYLAGVGYSATALNSGGTPFETAHLRAGPDNRLLAFGRGNRVLRVATRTSGSWSATTSFSAAGAHSCSNVLDSEQGAFDPQGHAHLVFRCDNSTSRLGYATNRSGSWQSYMLGDETVVGPTSIAIDAAGNLHIFYSATQTIKYTTASVPDYVFTEPTELYTHSDTMVGIVVSAISPTRFRGWFHSAGVSDPSVYAFEYQDAEFSGPQLVYTATTSMGMTPILFTY